MFATTPIVSSLGVGSDQSKSIAIYWVALLMSPRVMLNGLYIFSMSSNLVIDEPIPACTQKTLCCSCLSSIMAASGM